MMLLEANENVVLAVINMIWSTVLQIKQSTSEMVYILLLLVP